MGALAQPQDTSWIPQDDILLKTAVEAGASLESLAKGAANFSQRFTVEELEDRWNGLLYDPLVSIEASVRMVEIEHSKENSCFSGKRKFDSVRQQYHAMRKRICNEPLNSSDVGCTIEPSSTNALENGEHPLTSECIPTHCLENNVGLQDSNLDIDTNDYGFCAGKDVSGDQDNITNVIAHRVEEKTDGGTKFPSIAVQSQTGEVSGYSGFEGDPVLNLTIPDCGASFHSREYSFTLPDSPIWNEIEGISSSILPDIGTDGDFGLGTSELGYDVRLSDVMLDNQQSGSSTDDYLAELSNSLFDFSNVEDFLMGSEENIMHKSYIDNYSSFLLDSSIHNGTLNVAANSNAGPNISDNHTCRADIFGHPDGKERSSALNPEYRNGVICCVLNTEDPDIPCNDDVFLLTHPSLSNFSLPSWKRHEPPPHRASSLSKDSSRGQKVNAGDPNLPPQGSGCKLKSPRTDDHSLAWKASISTEVPAQSRSVNLGGCHFIPQPLNETFVKAERDNSPSYNPDGFCLDKQAGGFDRLISFPQNNGIDSNQETQNAVINLNRETLKAEVDPTDLAVPDLSFKHSLTNQDEFPTWSEDDVPCFSDVEAMILDMDLSPDDQYFNPRRTVLKYETEDTKRMIIRLEQTAAACMQRNMSSRGAFAVLYGRDSKYYIKKPEVLLGRSTEDIIVDIDLGREGQNSKVSRRQAIIAMGKDGSFVLRNIGRRSIFVNDKEVAQKHSLVLFSGCLIEVRGTPFIFETNGTCIKRYLDEIKNES